MQVNPVDWAMPTQAERSGATRAALVAAGQRLFGERGFAATSIEEIAGSAQLTRGALYHHFESKESLFLAVFESVERDLMATAAKVAIRGADAWQRLRLGCLAFIEACADPMVERIVLLDAPAVLGWDTWRAVDERYALALLRGGIEAATGEGFLPPRSSDAMAHILLGAMTEAAMLMARSRERSKARAEVTDVVDALLAGLREGARS